MTKKNKIWCVIALFWAVLIVYLIVNGCVENHTTVRESHWRTYPTKGWIVREDKGFYNKTTSYIKYFRFESDLECWAKRIPTSDYEKVEVDYKVSVFIEDGESVLKLHRYLTSIKKKYKKTMADEVRPLIQLACSHHNLKDEKRNWFDKLTLEVFINDTLKKEFPYIDINVDIVSMNFKGE